MTCERQIISGELHYARIPHEYWRARLRMAAALGVNAVSTYVFWNRHERTPGKYDFEGDNDIRAFIGFAKDEGLDVIVRPGPYVCAEWDFGGLPAWLLRDGNLRVRSTDELFLTPVRRWFARLGEEIRSLQRAHGGPIIAVQLENEYGAFGSDPEYLRAVRSALGDAGFTQSPIFTIDQPNDLAAGCLPDIPIASTFAPGDPAQNLARIRELRPSAPLLCGEYWAGWYDRWGEPHANLDDAQQIVDLEWMLAQGVSVNVYMLHGGTNFGFWNGANATDSEPYQPVTTSYGYCAAIDEAGRPAAKYHGFRAAIERVTGRTLPAVPEIPPCASIAAFELNESAALRTILEDPICAERPLTMEQLDQAFGFVLYRTTIEGSSNGVLHIEGLRDYATVSIDGRIVARLDRRTGEDSIRIDASGRVTLDLLVENCGRINYGSQFPIDRKGITGRVTLDGHELTPWEMYRLPMEPLPGLRFDGTPPSAPCFYKGAFTIEKPADTFFDVSDLGKGVLWVNGRNLGRFWNIGPQRSLYVPEPWLCEGRNEVVAFDVIERNSRPRLRGVRAALFDR